MTPDTGLDKREDTKSIYEKISAKQLEAEAYVTGLEINSPEYMALSDLLALKETEVVIGEQKLERYKDQLSGISSIVRDELVRSCEGRREGRVVILPLPAEREGGAMRLIELFVRREMIAFRIEENIIKTPGYNQAFRVVDEHFSGLVDLAISTDNYRQAFGGGQDAAKRAIMGWFQGVRTRLHWRKDGTKGTSR